MLLTLVIVGGVLLLIAAVWLVALNYKSDTLISNGTTAVVVGVAGLLATLWFTLKAPAERDDRFPVVFVLHNSTRLPLFLPTFSSAWQYADPAQGASAMGAPWLEGLKEKALPNTPPDTAALQDLYMDVLVSYVMDIMGSVFGTTWHPDVFSFELAYSRITTFGPAPHTPVIPGSTVEIRELVKRLPHEPVFADKNRHATKFVVPPRTTVVHWKAQDDGSRVLEMANPFVKVTMTVERHFWGVGSGALGALLGLSVDQSQKETCTVAYVMKLHASFERLRSGHPLMPQHVKWVDTLFSQLGKLNGEEKWHRLKQEYALDREIAAKGPFAESKGSAESSPASDTSEPVR
jgi:hypothetical protein